MPKYKKPDIVVTADQGDLKGLAHEFSYWEFDYDHGEIHNHQGSALVVISSIFIKGPVNTNSRNVISCVTSYSHCITTIPGDLAAAAIPIIDLREEAIKLQEYLGKSSEEFAGNSARMQQAGVIGYFERADFIKLQNAMLCSPESIRWLLLKAYLDNLQENHFKKHWFNHREAVS